MKYISIDSPEPVVEYLAGRISTLLQNNQKVLWLLSGGSAIKVAVAVAEQLESVPKDNLAISLCDERHGEVGHKDSNWQQLIDAGLDVPGARMLPVLSGKDFEQTARDYAKLLKTEFAKADVVIALAGMGPDGHIFGIKPDSPSVESELPVIAYKWDDYARLTPTLAILKDIDEVILFAMGQEKHPQLEDLEKEIPPMSQPAQLLKQLKNVIIYNDYRND